MAVASVLRAPFIGAHRLRAAQVERAAGLRIPHKILLVCILSLAAALRWHHIGAASLWTDEFLSLGVAAGNGYRYFDLPHGVILDADRGAHALHAPGGWRELITSLRHSNNPPLYFIALRLWRDLWGADDDATLRGLSSVFSVLAVLAAFDVVRLLHGITTALWAAAFLALATPQLLFAQEMRSYAMLVASMLGCCALIARIECFGLTRGRLILLMFCAAAMLLTHYLGFSLLAALAIYTALRFRGQVRAATLVALASAATIMLLIWGPMWWVQLHTFKPTLAWQNDDAPGLAWRLLGRVACLPVRLFMDPGDHPSPLCYAGFALYLLPIPLLRRNPHLLLWCLILWINVLVIATGDALRSTMSISIARYTLPAAAAANILAAILLANLPTRNRWLRIVAPAVVALSCALALPQAYVRYRSDFPALARYLDAKCSSDETIVFYPTQREPWYVGILDVAVSHYARHSTQRVVFLVEPADQALQQQLTGRGTVDIVSGSLEPEKILPGCHVIEQTYIPFVGFCARVNYPPSVSSK